MLLNEMLKFIQNGKGRAKRVGNRAQNGKKLLNDDFFGPGSCISLQPHWRRSVQIRVFMASFPTIALSWGQFKQLVRSWLKMDR
jgi:hypothetical protein